MRRSMNTQCPRCGDTLRLVYDSRDKSPARYEQCSCGKVKVNLDKHGNMCYDPHDGHLRPRELEGDERDYQEEWYEEDHICLTPEMEALVAEIRALGKKINGRVRLHFNEIESDDSIHFHLSAYGSIEPIDIHADEKIRDENAWWGSEEKKQEQMARITEALTRFKNICEQVLAGSMDLQKPHRIWEDKTLKWNERDREALDLYRYNLYC